MKRINRKRSISRVKYKSMYLGLTVIMLLFAYLRIFPIFKIFFMSMFNWNMATDAKEFIGLGNYSTMLKDSTFRGALYITFYIGLAIVLITVPLALAIAYAIHRNIKFKSYFETCFFIPYIIPMVPVVIMWKWIFNTKYGLLNYALSFLGIDKMAWLTNSDLAPWAIVIITVWKNLGYCILILSVGLAGIPRDYYEAAEIDGASAWAQFKRIALPLLMPVIVYVTVIMMIRGFNVYTQAYILASDSSGSPGYVVRVVVYDMMENGFRFFKMGYAAAEAVILFLIIFALTFVQIIWGNEDRRDAIMKKLRRRK